MKAIYKRELSAYFHSFLGALFVGAMLLLMGIYFSVYNLFMGYPYIGYALSAMVFLFLIGFPVLTMRILAEERHQKTDQLILTAPVSISSVVMGKFLALATIFAIPVAVVCLYPLILSRFGTVSFGESYLAVLGFFLYGLACIAIGIFVSSLTESQVIAAILTFGILFLGYIMSGICNMISSTGNLLTKILKVFDMVSRFDGFLNGSLQITGILYFLSITVLFLIFTVQSIQKRRYQVSGKTISMSTYSLSVVVLGTALAVLLNALAAELPERYKAIDVTANKLYSLSDETKELAEALTEDVNIYVLVNQEQADDLLASTLENYEGLSSHIKVSYVDPAVNPKFYTQYTDGTVSYNSLIVEGSKRNKVIDYNDIYQSEFDYTTYSSTVTGYDGEGQLTSAIAYVTTEDMPKIYLLEGHGEAGFDSSFQSSLKKENVDYETINLLQHDSVPEDAQCVVVNVPTEDLSADDTQKLTAYMDNGGKVLFITGYTGKEMPNWSSLLAYYGVSASDGLIIEADRDHYYGRNPFYLLPEISYDEITSGVTGSGSYVFAPEAQGLRVEEREDTEITELLTSSEESYVRNSPEESSSYEKQEGDEDGPFAVGVKCVKTVGEKQSTAVIYSSAYLFTADADLIVSGTNAKLFAGTIGSLVDHISSVSVPVKSYSINYLTIPESSVVLLSLVTAVVLPLFVLIGGFLVWFKRRKK